MSELHEKSGIASLALVFPSKGRWGIQVLRGLCRCWDSSNPSIPTPGSEGSRQKFTVQRLHSRCSAGDVY